ncbi:thiamine-phosphate diphosphorylase [Tamilnaduibacter salinus]|uniref:Thiamine-phosphate synthase n=1 Tax=Tamilnaduibacter salinus TaxID=1484056 RepID=A0A2U1CXT5_9GAMM|nr:thiamine phosphate synthase [Tamilnaduibacter salinus]PVY77048.1 thiamine-phosphate diphosphorylase [Tamilnaduibacter salinus]
MRTVPRGLYAVTDPTLLPEDRLIPAVEAALQGGTVLVQYRDKAAGEVDRRRRAESLLSLCRNYHVPLLINDDLDLAQRIDADGVHLGQSDGRVDEARHRLGDQALVGRTCHDRLDLAREAADQGADYLAFGRFFPSVTKPEAPAATPDILTEAQTLNRPTSAIGGITLENAALLIAHGADLLAVIGGLFATDDVAARARAFDQLFHASPDRSS